jgi:S-DNA-T family DNA segregation ATPase FtsK/SpoIIIE
MGTSVRTASPRNTRRNEIIAIALFAASALATLSLATYHPNDPSWNTAGQNEATRNLAGSIGANLAASLFQAFGLAAYLVPLLLIAAAWRRFRIRRFHAPLSRVIGLALLTLSVSALLAISGMRPLYDASFQPGGLMGTVIARVLASGLSNVGASVLLVAVAATGVLLATDFSFALAYERLALALEDRLAHLHALPQRFRAWRKSRRQQALARIEARRAARAEQEKRRAPEKTAAERVAEFMREGEPLPVIEKPPASPAAEALKRSTAAGAAAENRTRAATEKPAGPRISSPSPAVSASTQATQALVPVKRTATDPPPPPATPQTLAPEMAPATSKENEIAAMLETASVKRTETDDAPDTMAEPMEPKGPRGAGAKAQAVEAASKAAPPYEFPLVDFLKPPPPHCEQAEEELYSLAKQLAEKCREFNVTGKIEHICPGPVVTTYEFKPDPGVKYSRVTGLVDDLCLALKAESIRIDRLPGKAHVGIEVPNPHRETIFLREVIESRRFRESTSKLTIALGKTIDGMNYVADLAKMPHLLIAGATGSGKSVCVNSLVVSILYKARPDEVKFIMVDPKRLELGLYADIPHLATPIITDPKRAAHALKWAVSEMERRYKELAGWGVRNIDGFNLEVLRRNSIEDFDDQGEPWKPLPYIVILIDELADLMMVSGHEVEESITRLAQMARAVGIHLVLATQRPSVDVITGLIKANFPSRISFRVSSKVDSRTIIDANGAEQLLGRGDMLFLPPGTSRLVRVHGGYVDEAEINRVVAHIKAQSRPTYDETITQSEEEADAADGGSGERDELFDDALRICVEMKRASTSVLQRRLRIGYGRAAAILDAMEREGFIGPADGARPRPVLSRAFETVAHWDDLASEEAP